MLLTDCEAKALSGCGVQACGNLLSLPPNSGDCGPCNSFISGSADAVSHHTTKASMGPLRYRLTRFPPRAKIPSNRAALILGISRVLE